MIILTVEEYNQIAVVKYGDWAAISRKGFVATDEDYNRGTWGRSEQSALNKFKKQSREDD